MNAPRLARLTLALVFATIADYATRIAVKLGGLNATDTVASMTDEDIERFLQERPCCRG